MRSIDLDSKRAKAAREREPDLRTRLFMHKDKLGAKVDELDSTQEQKKRKVKERLKQFNRKKTALQKAQASGMKLR